MVLHVYQMVSENYQTGEWFYTTEKEALKEAQNCDSPVYVARWTVGTPPNGTLVAALLNRRGWAIGPSTEIYSKESETVAEKS